jgi:hypothetical protein
MYGQYTYSAFVSLTTDSGTYSETIYATGNWAEYQFRIQVPVSASDDVTEIKFWTWSDGIVIDEVELLYDSNE